MTKKMMTFAFIAITIINAGCSPIATPVLPTQTPLATYTPMPTYTPAPIYTPNPAFTSAPEIDIVGISFMSADWNPRKIDLSSASDEGILIDVDYQFQLVDVSIRTQNKNSSLFEVQSLVYLNEEKGENRIGSTDKHQLIDGIMSLGEVVPSESLKVEIVDNPGEYGWQPNENWKNIILVVNILDESEKIVNSSEANIRVTQSNGNAWFIQAPYAHIVSVIYQVNDGEKQTLDFRTLQTEGIDVLPGDTLRIWEIWYHSRDGDTTKTFFATSYLGRESIYVDDYCETICESNPKTFDFNSIQNIIDTVPFEWVVPPDRNSLTISLLRNDNYPRHTVLDLIRIDFKPSQ